MSDHLIVVEAVVPTRRDHTNLRDDAWSFALDQRAFGPRRLVVAFANRKGRFRGLAHTERTDPPDLALEACLHRLGRAAAAAVAYSDEPVTDGPPPDDLAERFRVASNLCATFEVHLVDWIACDDQRYRSSRLTLVPDREWWDVP